MDVLTDVMQTVRVRSHCYGRAEFTAPWGITVPEAWSHAAFYVISRGSCWLEMDGLAEPVPMAGGDFICLPHGKLHSFRDAMGSVLTPLDEIGRTQCDKTKMLNIGGGGASTSMIWGCFEFEDGGRNPLLDSLPPIIHLQSNEGGAEVRWLQSTLQFIASESASNLPGSETVVNRLTDILFVHAVRAYITGCTSHGCRASGWLRALTDPKVGEALRLIHESPEKNWSVAMLAESVAMSRSAFAAQFSELVGEPPLRYVTAWRMKKASHLLLQGETISLVAQAVGYDTDAAFGKAFRRYMGTTPGSFRKHRRTPLAECNNALDAPPDSVFSEAPAELRT
ncbi:AraC family transcriptional regulator [Phycisphaerales bacterium AB-hyl4]|uniref:AraC family transcriptional regulator n=1 Tax=Natronomicrosphaera hydrolytica TaxID=3242702 RepID=A0ABV4UC83_9BACT